MNEYKNKNEMKMNECMHEWMKERNKLNENERMNK